MSEAVFTSLLFNSVLLLAVVQVLDLATEFIAIGRLNYRPLIMGIFLGVICVGVMMVPLSLLPGVFFDVRSVVIAISGLFFGAVPTVVAMLMALTYRLFLGGAGAWVGVSVIIASGLIGMAWRYWGHIQLASVRWRQLLGLGVVVHVVMLLLMRALPTDIADKVLQDVSLPVLILYPLLTVILGAVLSSKIARQGLSEALKESEERLKLALSASNQGIFDVDVKKGTTIVSQEYAQMLGYDPEIFRETRKNWIKRLHPDDREKAVKAYRDYIAGSVPEYRVEFRQRTATGEWKWFLNKGKLVTRDAQGEGGRMIGTSTDITARKVAEESLRLSEQRFRSVVVESPFPILLHAEGGEIIQVSNSWCEITGYTRDELQTISDWTRLAYGKEWTRIKGDIDKLFEANRRVYEGDFNIQTKLGDKRIWEFSSAPLGSLPDGRRLVISMAMDVTERRNAEQALIDNEVSMRRIQKIASLGSWCFDINQGRLDWSAEAEYIFGYSNMHPKNLEEFYNLVYPEDREKVEQAINRGLDGDPYDIEYRIVIGELIKWVRAVGELTRDASGVAQTAVGSIQDITERKRSEEALIGQAEELKTRNEELQRFNELTVGREMDIIELKKNINVLSIQLGEKPPYSLAFLDVEVRTGECDHP
ncbi:PAS domain S-box protein [Sedimenticola selenatireducens]|uniref:histidine kinase n=1 Tax=Sedimenticola selenatireducens TaxID=191960 RepID=A0A557SMY3_9GAMM|nr:PAS domain S-box protein [Sedimenticola selenatireducens]TVO78710.1 PAS domain S-box protein [Sedimenticola selenatireducens]TVT62072.1 MAG: PAS domain S-box protein [Sedimenticola selenatireducens]